MYSYKRGPRNALPRPDQASIQKNSCAEASGSCTEIPTSEESDQEVNYMNVPDEDTNEERELIIGISSHPLTRLDSENKDRIPLSKKIHLNDKEYIPYTCMFGQVYSWYNGAAEVCVARKCTST